MSVPDSKVTKDVTNQNQQSAAAHKPLTPYEAQMRYQQSPLFKQDLSSSKSASANVVHSSAEVKSLYDTTTLTATDSNGTTGFSSPPTTAMLTSASISPPTNASLSNSTSPSVNSALAPLAEFPLEKYKKYDISKLKPIAFEAGKLVADWQILSAQVNSPNAKAIMANTPLLNIDDFKTEFDITPKVETLLENSAAADAMCDFEDFLTQVTVDKTHPLYNEYKDFAQTILVALGATTQISGWQRIPDFAIKKYQGKIDANLEKARYQPLLDSAKPLKTAIDGLQVTGQGLLNHLLVRVEWVRRMMLASNLPFNPANCLKILAVERNWMTAAKAYENECEKEVANFITAHNDLYTEYRQMQKKGVEWPHAKITRSQIEKGSLNNKDKSKDPNSKESLSKSDNDNSKSDNKIKIDNDKSNSDKDKTNNDKSDNDNNHNSDQYAFTPMMIKRDRCSCYICGIEMSGFRPWHRKRLNRTHDWENQHPYYEAKIKAKYHPLYLAMVWDEQNLRRNYSWAKDAIRYDANFDPNQIIDPLNQRTALHYLAYYGDLRFFDSGILSQLLDLKGKKPDLTLKDKDGKTPAQIAKERGFKPLYMAIFWERDFAKIKKLIEDKDFDPTEIIDPIYKRTALHWLAELGMKKHINLEALLKTLSEKVHAWNALSTDGNKDGNNKTPFGIADAYGSSPLGIFKGYEYLYDEKIRNKIEMFFNGTIPQSQPQPLPSSLPQPLPQSLSSSQPQNASFTPMRDSAIVAAAVASASGNSTISESSSTVSNPSTSQLPAPPGGPPV